MFGVAVLVGRPVAGLLVGVAVSRHPRHVWRSAHHGAREYATTLEPAQTSDRWRLFRAVWPLLFVVLCVAGAWALILAATSPPQQ